MYARGVWYDNVVPFSASYFISDAGCFFGCRFDSSSYHGNLLSPSRFEIVGIRPNS